MIMGGGKLKWSECGKKNGVRRRKVKWFGEDA